MSEPKAKRVSRERTDAEKGRLAKLREEIRQELPDLVARDQMRKDARDEGTLSGELRRSVGPEWSVRICPASADGPQSADDLGFLPRHHETQKLFSQRNNLGVVVLAALFQPRTKPVG